MISVLREYAPGLELDGPVAENNDTQVQGMEAFLAGVERRAYRTAVSMVRDTHEAMDIVQDAMLKLVQRYANRPATEWPLLFHRILHNRIMDTHRRRKAEGFWVRLFDRDAEDSERDVVYEEPAAPVQWQPLAQLERAAFATALDAAVQNLPARQQQAFFLRIWEGLDVQQTAQVMAVSEGSVKTHLFRALASLRQQLGEFQP
ncbi:MAG: RNA polymerase sigma factor [Gammaproteobacteria bacterium]|nr:RNA polymerase sigma factor [Gammaproteobacteria bacterium]